VHTFPRHPPFCSAAWLALRSPKPSLLALLHRELLAELGFERNSAELHERVKRVGALIESPGATRRYLEQRHVADVLRGMCCCAQAANV
jgi:hypothetical protein